PGGRSAPDGFVRASTAAVASFVATRPRSSGSGSVGGDAAGPSASGPGRPSIGPRAGSGDPGPTEADLPDTAGPLASFVTVGASPTAAGSTATGSEPVGGRSSGATNSHGRRAPDSSASRAARVSGSSPFRRAGLTAVGWVEPTGAQPGQSVGSTHPTNPATD